MRRDKDVMDLMVEIALNKIEIQILRELCIEYNGTAGNLTPGLERASKIIRAYKEKELNG